METIIARNPSTQEPLKTFSTTPVDTIPQLINEAREAQKVWATISPKQRAATLLNASEFILDNLDSLVELIQKENGKPQFEALTNDIIPALDLLNVYAKRLPRLMRPQHIPLTLMKHRKSFLQYWPKGVVAIISPWNYPFSIPFGEIALALLAGNAVLFKPSESALMVGEKIVDIFRHTGIPEKLLIPIYGDAHQGNALVQAAVDKIFFTGSVSTGRAVMRTAADGLKPVVLELGGKDPMIVLQNADLDLATSAALWGAFSNSGQACASVERILVQEEIHDKFVDLLRAKVTTLKPTSLNGDRGDLGVITLDKQKDVYATQLKELHDANSNILFGGSMDETQKRLLPTIVTNPKSALNCPIETTSIYNQETFGPVVAVSTFKTIGDAIQKANQSKYGLLASIFTRDIALAEQIAAKLEVGSVLINEVLYTHGLSETPWGGVKDSGFGRVHSDQGFYEFLNARHIHRESWWAIPFKSLWWFPYTTHQRQLFENFAKALYRRSFIQRIRAIPHLLVELVQMLKSEPRI